ncbi:hypothetical protein J2X47_001786 [Sphingomonas sp. BE270]|jgi:hypothetical protein|uniref:hypothetical protein n=1 Tax=unclassified Sphingomonas TaxID=196159 RepID=UPI0010F98EBE|nr:MULTISPECIES: hypothetical protein [unclassified Sphingomonas]MDR6847574.1 hypothetical protein [Sphingomonas sp. BE137]MDR7257606.1 hypothetical protein [Sphingomonas sp. BE270]
MRQRDLAWRGVGAVAFAFAAAIGLADRMDGGSLLALPAFGVALIGLVLIVQGKRVAAAVRVERSRHRALLAAIRARRARRSGEARR